MNRSTWTITLRLKKEIRSELDKRAAARGLTTGQYLQECINRSLKSGIPDKVEANDSGVPVVHQTKLTKQELQDMIHKIEGKTTVIKHAEVGITRVDIPWYDPERHTSGDTVRMRDPKTKEVKVVTL